MHDAGVLSVKSTRPGTAQLGIVLGWRNVTRHLRRSVFAIVAVSLSIVALMLASGFVEWIFWQLREATIYSQLGHIQITKKGYAQSGTADPFAYLLPGESKAREQIEGLPEVESVAPRLYFSGLAGAGDSTYSFIGEGISPDREHSLSRMVKIEQGTNLSQDQVNGALLGEGLAKSMGVSPGDALVLMANSANAGINAVEVRVMGTFSTAYKSYDDSALRIHISAARRLLRVDGAHKWLIVLKDTDATHRVQDQIQRSLHDANLELTPWHELADFYKKARTLFEQQIHVLKLIICIAIVLAIANSFMMNVVERTAEIGTVAAIGSTRTLVLVQFLSEGMVIGAIGGIIGIVLGIVAAYAVSAIGIPMPPPPGMAHGYIGQVRVTPALAFEAFVLALATSLIAAWFPAWRASSMNIVDALRHAR